MKQTQAVLLSDTDSGGGVLFWIRLKSVVLTQGGTKEKKNEWRFVYTGLQPRIFKVLSVCGWF